VELGAAHDQQHERVGAIAGEICDIAVVVRPERIPGFIRGFRRAGPDKSIVEVKRFLDAAHWLHRNTQGGDVILIENDLPDLYENLPKI
jgi:UDP-N-acetylmuramoyl-tripeptide--D-alanyl-D-alanine ligase